MQIMHAVTLVSDDGAFGGPVSVATTQLRALHERGHDVVLTALWGGSGVPPGSIDGVELRARRARAFVPRTGALGKFSAGYVGVLWRTVGAADVVHVHTGRDLASLAALNIAAIRRKPVVVQTHGMVDVRTGVRARAFDTLLRPLIKRASACLVLTDAEAAGVASVLGASSPPLICIPNGVKPGRHSDRRRGMAPATVLYLARLHARKRPTTFVQTADLVLQELRDVHFDIYGPDEGALEDVRGEIARLGIGAFVTYHGAVNHEKAQQLTADADVYILPSVREPFPMSVLEALAVGTPVVCTTSTGISDELARRGAAIVTDGSAAQLAKGTVAILRDSALRADLVRAGDKAVSEVFSIDAVAATLEQTYRNALHRGAAPS
jgi:glycosyltransferase involved in cell wall biosynthesis